MNRRQAIENATHLRKGTVVFVKVSGEAIEHKTISAAKRASRALGLGAVALKDKETFPDVQP